MLIFRSEEHVDRWCAVRDMTRGAVVTPEQGWRLADAWYRTKLRADWRRHTLEEAEAVLADIGLTGPDWNLRE